MAPTGGGATGPGGGNIKVVVRVRPFNGREINRNAKCIVQMQGDQTILLPPPDAEDRLRKSSKSSIIDGQKVFKYDKSYWSFNTADSHFAGQGSLFADLGVPLLDNAFKGYNNCIFAYGQTGSGKSYSMMGYGDEVGVIPKICRDMFERMESLQADQNLTCTVEVSYLEIYNERVRDLLNPATKGNLRVREHPSTGPYVEDLASLVVRSFPEIENLMDEGNKARTVASTNMNDTSSRSHAVFTLTLTQKRHDIETNMDTEKVAQISLVDLAGSERQTSSGATGARLKEGAEINKSLSTLGRVIATLADLSTGKKGLKVPYRDSVLTWLLKDSLGGNSMTAMIAAISPADINFEETLSTLRYADSAKRIKNHAVINEDPNARMIRELKEELAQLRSKLGSGGAGGVTEIYPPGTPLDQQMVSIVQADGTTKRVSKAEIMEQLSQSEKLYQDLNQTWEEKLLKTQEIHREREAALEELGISIEKGNVGLSTPKKMPHLVNLSDDPLLAECLVYNLKPGTTSVGNVDAENNTSEIRLKGSKILSQHCTLENVDNVVTVVPKDGAAIIVNGVRVDKARRLKSGNRIIFGDFHIFRFNNPLEAKAEKTEKGSLLRHSVAASQLGSPPPSRPGHERQYSTAASEHGYDSSRAQSPMLRGRDSDWSYARREAAGAILGTDSRIMDLTDDQLDSLFENVQRAREERRGRSDGRLSDLDDESDDLSSFLVRDKYLSAGTLDNFSLDTALTMADIPSDTGSPEDDEDITLKAVQIDPQNEVDEHREEPEDEPLTVEKPHNETHLREDKAKMEQDLEVVRKEFERQLQKQKADYEAQIKSMATTPEVTNVKSSQDRYSELSSAEVSIARWTSERWQQRNYMKIAELLLQNGGLLKEAQIMSKVMTQNVSFQFAIVDSGQEKASAYDLILQDISDEDDALTDARKPCLGVRVVDAQNSVIYLWSIAKLRQRVSRMRQMHQYLDRPEYRQHFRLDSPFGERNALQYSLIGDATVPLAAVYETRVQDFAIDVTSLYTQHTIGKLRLSLEPSLAQSSPGNIKFNIVMRDMSGFAEHEGTLVHAQLYVVGSSDESIASTKLVEGFRDGLIRFESVHSLSVPQADARNASMKVAVFARITSMHLDKLSSWDEIREMADKPINEEQAPRLPESEYELEERHDVFAKFQIHELAEDGHYRAVEVVQSVGLDDGVYQLHQGLQRRISVSLTYSTAEHLPWDDLKSIRIGDIYLVDAAGQVADVEPDTSDIMLKQIREPMIMDNADGTSSVTISGQWDSSLHKSLLLDRTTSESTRVRFSVHWDIVSSRLEEPMTFSIDQHLQILPRSYSRPHSILKSFWNRTPVTHSTNGVFLIVVRPLSAKRAADLWRLDTSKDFINGEELLEHWAPRGISLVKDYLTARQKRRQLEDIEAVRGSLGLRKLAISRPAGLRTASPSQPVSRQSEILQKYVTLWQQPLLTMTKPIFDTDHSSGSVPTRATVQSSHRSTSKPRFAATVTHIPRAQTSLKSGHLLMPSDAGPAQPSTRSQGAPVLQWIRRFIDIRPPYLYIHSVPNGDTINAINLTYARVDHDPDFIRLLAGAESTTKSLNSADDHGREGTPADTSSAGRAPSSPSLSGLSHVFAVYGEQNTYLFAARSDRAKLEWILALDRSYVDDGPGDEDEG